MAVLLLNLDKLNPYLFDYQDVELKLDDSLFYNVFGLPIEVTSPNQPLMMFLVYFVTPIVIFQILSLYGVGWLLQMFPGAAQQTKILQQKGRLFELYQRVIRTVFAGPILYYSLTAIFNKERSGITELHYVYIATMLFHIADFAILVIYKSTAKDMYLHHIVTIVGCVLCITIKKAFITGAFSLTFDVLVPFSTIISWSNNYNQRFTLLYIISCFFSLVGLIVHRIPTNIWLLYTAFGRFELGQYIIANLASASILSLELHWTKLIARNFFQSIDGYRSIKKN
ncbi:hypothetical protein SAMD00019534_051150, partial [Acytostelium subglobosum LB1]|uniref:hypothetical protein n=1 Tax=Acytostelium subglobosum LB1 TaxID=1410327 RepID=UPI000644F906